MCQTTCLVHRETVCVGTDDAVEGLTGKKTQRHQCLKLLLNTENCLRKLE